MTGTVCLTIDFDATSLWIQREMTTVTSISRGEYGVLVVPRILHMLKKRGIKCTWFIPGHTIETYPEVCQMIVDQGHEVGLHGYMHENFNDLSEDKEWEILERTVQIGKQLTGQMPKGFPSPAWNISSRTLENLEKLGPEYDSSQMGNDYSPYYSRKKDEYPEEAPIRFGEESKIVEVPVSWSLDDYPHFEYLKTPNSFIPGLQNPNHVFDNWMGDVDYMLRDFKNGVMVATVHPQVIGRGHRFLGLEKWIDQVLEKGATFARIDEVTAKFLEGHEFGKYLSND